MVKRTVEKVTVKLKEETMKFLETHVLGDFYREGFTLLEYLLEVLSDFSYLLPYEKEMSLKEVKALVLDYHSDGNLKVKHAMDFLGLVDNY